MGKPFLAAATAADSSHSLHAPRGATAAIHGIMQRVSVLLLAAGVAFGLIQGVAGVRNATVEAPYSQALGLSCSVDTDCGYVPSLACIDGYDVVVLASTSTSADRLSCSYPGGATTAARGISTAATTPAI